MRPWKLPWSFNIEPRNHTNLHKKRLPRKPAFFVFILANETIAFYLCVLVIIRV